MKKELLNFKTLAILVVMCLAGTLGANAYDFTDYDYNMYFNYLSDGSVEVTYYDENYNSYSGAVTIPAVATRGAINQTTFDVTSIGTYAFRRCSDLTSISIPTSITSIGQSAFSYCTKLQSVTIPYSVKTIGFNAFGDCNNLKVAFIGSGVTNIAAYGFDSPLTEVYCFASTPPAIANENAFRALTYSDGTLYVNSPFDRQKYRQDSNWQKFNNILTMNPYDFYYNGLYYVLYNMSSSDYDNPDYCRVIYHDTNYNSYSSSSIHIPERATYQGKWREVEAVLDRSFKNCTNLTSITIPYTVATVFHEAFWNCNNLRTVVIGSGCQGMGDDLFYGCTSMNSLTVFATTPPHVFNGTFNSYLYNNTTLYVPASAISAYKNANHWKNFTKIQSIPSTTVEINATNFPDVNFRAYLFSQYPAGYITGEEIAALTSLNVSSKGISDLTGIKFFTALKELRCYNNPMTSLDVSDCTSLTYLDCAPTNSYTGTKLTSLNVRGCLYLQKILCYNNNITSLDLTGCISLRELHCFNCPKLTSLNAYYKSSLYLIDCSNCTSLNQLSCHHNALSTLDISGNTALTSLSCFNNPNLTTITGLDDCTAITYLDCEDCAITDLSAVNNMNDIQSLYCRNNQLTQLNVTYKSKLKNLLVAGNKSLTSLQCYDNALTNLDVTNCTALTNMSCTGNKLTSLSLSGCPALVSLYCNRNYISGTAMTQLVNSLPMRSSSNPGTFRVVNITNENNVITPEQLAIARSKYWNPKKWDGSSWVDITNATRGDVNGDGNVNITDITALIDYLLKGNTGNINQDAADCNQDSVVNISDIPALTDYLLRGTW